MKKKSIAAVCSLCMVSAMLAGCAKDNNTGIGGDRESGSSYSDTGSTADTIEESDPFALSAVEDKGIDDMGRGPGVGALQSAEDLVSMFYFDDTIIACGDTVTDIINQNWWFCDGVLDSPVYHNIPVTGGVTGGVTGEGSLLENDDCAISVSSVNLTDSVADIQDCTVSGVRIHPKPDRHVEILGGLVTGLTSLEELKYKCSELEVVEETADSITYQVDSNAKCKFYLEPGDGQEETVIGEAEFSFDEVGENS